MQFRVLRVPVRLAMVSLLVVVSACSVFGGKAAEEPAHRIVLEDGAFEIRDYDAYALAETRVAEPFDAATRTGFGRLFDYISGANRGASEIAMTAPVVVAPEEIAMTAPVVVAPQSTSGAPGGFEDGADTGWTIAFVLPEGMSADTAPRPTDARVTLRDVPAQRVAVIRYGGFLGSASEARRRELADWLEARGLEHAGDWRLAGYNPPWTLPPFRRNEVVVTLRPQE